MTSYVVKVKAARQRKIALDAPRVINGTERLC
jgi:hypothetical protein